MSLQRYCTTLFLGKQGEISPIYFRVIRPAEEVGTMKWILILAPFALFLIGIVMWIIFHGERDDLNTFLLTLTVFILVFEVLLIAAYSVIAAYAAVS